MAEAIDIRELNIRIEQQSGFVQNLVSGMDQVIVGQKHLVDSLLIGLLSDGNILLEGVPGLAKTLAIKTLAQLIDATYSLCQLRAGGRNQPCSGKGAECIAGSHAGKTGDHWQRYVRIAKSFLGDGHAEPH